MFNLNETQHNILRQIWMKDSFTRQEISKELKINRSTVSRNIEGFLDESIIITDGEISAGQNGGRKTQKLTLNNDRFYVLGISIIKRRIFSILIDLKGNIVKKGELRKSSVGQSLIQDLKDEIKSYEKYFNKLLGISISLPGVIDSNSGLIKLSTNLELHKVNLKKTMEDEFGIYTFIENDANSGAASYLLYLKLQIQNLLYFMFFFPENILTLKGMGAGIVINKKLYKGSFYSAGEIKFKQNLPEYKNKSISIEDIKNYETVESSLKEDIELFISNLADKISEYSLFMNPDKIVLGGDILLIPGKIKNIFINKLYENMEKNHEESFILLDNNKVDTIAIGSAISFMNEFMNDYDFAKKILKKMKKGHLNKVSF
ncbi:MULTISPECIES: ROK family transcriptional regulator [Oceanotoga]|jgi:predicted NBD/HSP70 family sugar kinase|uniref:NBD/HSP70 family sugar kinase n=1 Tax=Oceanotoga teriensis TaxID=515440 RepID=A0AA45C6X5_9BACT|nr:MULTISPECIES: ROK family transcriptional regulator [Oceanotoga]MDN5342634.1 hypothetical protein [Oceanotoga sp.]MDO7975957.1 ROK family transcriptional regulator [Oceanotoga teriensis]PWJ95058.1 putative NBD/HSP70 family sugar kinase [Oceanotoga teriensis]